LSTEERELLTPQEVAELLRIPLATLQTWRSNRTGPTGYRVGRHIRYDRRDVEAWLAERRGYAAA
jgi:excisionase family DNA binding protein